MGAVHVNVVFITIKSYYVCEFMDVNVCEFMDVIEFELYTAHLQQNCDTEGRCWEKLSAIAVVVPDLALFSCKVLTFHRPQYFYCL